MTCFPPRSFAAAALAALAVSLAPAAYAAAPADKAALAKALESGDWPAAAKLGASAADIVRAAQAMGLYPDADPETAVVVISPSGELASVDPLLPLPPLPPEAQGAPTQLSAVDNGFQYPRGSIVLRPPYDPAPPPAVTRLR